MKKTSEQKKIEELEIQIEFINFMRKLELQEMKTSALLLGITGFLIGFLLRGLF